jgi:hypothetical protein
VQAKAMPDYSGAQAPPLHHPGPSVSPSQGRLYSMSRCEFECSLCTFLRGVVATWVGSGAEQAQ